ncbi:MAG TPA: sulfite exporter TauE/SafE family protein, partial [Candidatus Ozemobacteraceae bacterium]|nr:sulfite exporter TauE/SafE family protein [Candidatus Ozemobacteraceae bacterium]
MTEPATLSWYSRYQWSLIVVGAWIVATLWMSVWQLFSLHWPVSVTMMFGSFVAGATSEGGGAIAFPVFTKLLHIAPATARDFALAIQSIGMTCGSLLIIRSGYSFFPDLVSRVVFGAAVGVCAGLTWLVPFVPPPYPKILFTLFTVCFGVFLAWENFAECRPRDEEAHVHVELGWGACLVIGLLGGLISSVVGSGADVILFVVLCRRFSCHEKTATRTTIPIMALTSQIGFLFQMTTGKLAPGVLEMWWCAFPIV